MRRAALYLSNLRGKRILQRRVPQRPAFGALSLSAHGMPWTCIEAVRGVTTALRRVAAYCSDEELFRPRLSSCAVVPSK